MKTMMSKNGVKRAYGDVKKYRNLWWESISEAEWNALTLEKEEIHIVSENIIRK